MIKLVLIDFDDCLCQSEEACFIFENQVAESLGFSPMTREQHRANWGMPIRQAIVERIPGINPDSFMQQFAKLLPEAIATGVYDPIRRSSVEALQELRTSNKQLVIFTARTQTEVAHLMAKSHVLHHYIDHWYYQEYSIQQTGFAKPDPRALTGILSSLSVAANQAMLVGDSPSDGECANGAGVPFILTFESGLRSPADFSHIAIATTIHRFDQLPNAIAQLEE